MSKKQFLEDNLKPGEVYAGLILGKDGKPDEHLFLRPGHADKLNWANAIKWVADTGGRLPTRQEQALLYANCRPHLKPTWYWSCESYEGDASYAWVCNFGYGLQFNNRKSYEGSAVAVRSIPLTA